VVVLRRLLVLMTAWHLADSLIAIARGIAARSPAVEHAPAAKTIDIVVAALTLALMPPVGLTVMRLGESIESAAARTEGYQTVLYGLLAGALLIGVAGNAAAEIWWADPVATLVIAAFAWRCGRRLRGERPPPRTSG
jgi:divalent metal cation (Fe/Co/Zn/Cd) transporter